MQRLANTLITGALPSSPGNAMNISNGIVPIENWIEKKVLKGALRLMDTGFRCLWSIKKWNLTCHTKLINTIILDPINLDKEEQDRITPEPNLDIQGNHPSLRNHNMLH